LPDTYHTQASGGDRHLNFYGNRDNLFNRRKYNAAKTIETFSARLRDQVDLDTLARELLTVTDKTMEPTTVSLWLRPPDEVSKPRAPRWDY